jgi:hypothetical protein
MNFGYSFTFQTLDKGLIERVGPSGFTASIFNSSSNFVGYYSGILYHTTFIFIVFSAVFLSFFVLGSLGLSSSFGLSFALLSLSYVLLSFSDPFATSK